MSADHPGGGLPAGGGRAPGGRIRRRRSGAAEVGLRVVHPGVENSDPDTCSGQPACQQTGRRRGRRSRFLRSGHLGHDGGDLHDAGSSSQHPDGGGTGEQPHPGHRVGNREQDGGRRRCGGDTPGEGDDHRTLGAHRPGSSDRADPGQHHGPGLRRADRGQLDEHRARRVATGQRRLQCRGEVDQPAVTRFHRAGAGGHVDGGPCRRPGSRRNGQPEQQHDQHGQRQRPAPERAQPGGRRRLHGQQHGSTSCGRDIEPPGANGCPPAQHGRAWHRQRPEPAATTTGTWCRTHQWNWSGPGATGEGQAGTAQPLSVRSRRSPGLHSPTRPGRSPPAVQSAAVGPPAAP